MLLHRQGHGGGCPSNSHRLLQLSGADGSPNQEAHDVTHRGYRKTQNQGNPSDKHGIRLSDILHRRACCELQGEDLLSVVLSVPIPLGRRVHHLCLHDKDHAPANTSSYNPKIRNYHPIHD